MEAVIYYEEVPLTQWATIMIGIFIVALTPVAILEYFAVSREPALLWLYSVFDLIFIALMLNFRRMIIKISPEKVTVSFGVIRKTVKLEDITGFERINATLSVYTGMGVRYGGDGSLGFLPRLGEAVKLSLVSGRPLVFSTDNSERVLETLQRYCENKADE